jgi:hypothetical protein
MPGAFIPRQSGVTALIDPKPLHRNRRSFTMRGKRVSSDKDRRRRTTTSSAEWRYLTSTPSTFMDFSRAITCVRNRAGGTFHVQKAKPQAHGDIGSTAQF